MYVQWKYESLRGDTIDPSNVLFNCDNVYEEVTNDAVETDIIGHFISLECAITSKNAVFTRVIKFEIDIARYKTYDVCSLKHQEIAEFYNPIGYQIEKIQKQSNFILISGVKKYNSANENVHTEFLNNYLSI